MQSSKHTTIEISPKSILLVIFIPFLLYFLWFIRDIIFSLVIGFILMSALRPSVEALAKKIPRAAAVLVVYIVFVVVLLSVVSLIIPPIIIEVRGLLQNMPLYLEDIYPQIEDYVNIDNVGGYIPDVTNNLVGFISGLFSNMIFVVSTLFFGIYFLMEEELIPKIFNHYFDKPTAKKMVSTLRQAEKRMSSWFWGELSLMLVVGVLTYVGLTIIGIRYALPLAVLAGLLEVVPNIGPTISAIPAVIIGFSTSSLSGVSTLALYILIQQLENSLIVPYIMNKAVGINPIVTLLALLIGGRIGGVLGVLLAIPIYLLLETIYQQYFHRKGEKLLSSSTN